MTTVRQPEPRMCICNLYTNSWCVDSYQGKALSHRGLPIFMEVGSDGSQRTDENGPQLQQMSKNRMALCGNIASLTILGLHP